MQRLSFSICSMAVCSLAAVGSARAHGSHHHGHDRCHDGHHHGSHDGHHHGAPQCAGIASGEIITSEGEPVTFGFDEWGYNYQARLFIGDYCDALRGASACEGFSDVELKMSWNEAWLGTRDCDGDGLLDRHLGYDSYIGSGARLTNVMRGTYEQAGATCHWLQRSVFVAAPSDAELIDGIWYDAEGDELGPMIWDEFIVEDRQLHDPCGGAMQSQTVQAAEAVESLEMQEHEPAS